MHMTWLANLAQHGDAIVLCRGGAIMQAHYYCISSAFSTSWLPPPSLAILNWRRFLAWLVQVDSRVGQEQCGVSLGFEP
jgi:hypothetical protein